MLCLFSGRSAIRHTNYVTREIIAEEAPSLYVALSSDISPRIREFSRSATTIVNTQIAPRLRNYLIPLEDELRQRGFEGALLVMQGSGGCVKAREAPRHAVSTLGSVLTGGIVGCTNLGAALGHKNIISTDIGGTTFLVGLVVDGKPVTATSTVINQYSISSVDGRGAHDRRRRRGYRVD